MKLVILAITLAGISLNAFALTQQEKEEFADFYRQTTQLSLDSPNDLVVKVMFFDINGDGIEEAFATAKPSYYETGYLWTGYKKQNGKWIPIKGFEPITQQDLLSAGIYGRVGEFLRCVLPDGRVDHVILSQNYDNQITSGLGELNKSRFWIDSEGVLQQEKIENLERYIAYQGTHRDKLIQEMQVLKVETFDIPKKEEPNKAVEPTR